MKTKNELRQDYRQLRKQLSGDEVNDLSRKITKQLGIWLEGQEERFIKKVKKIFEGASVDKRYSIMEPSEVFTATSFEEKNDIYSRPMPLGGCFPVTKDAKRAPIPSCSEVSR